MNNRIYSFANMVNFKKIDFGTFLLNFDLVRDPET